MRLFEVLGVHKVVTVAVVVQIFHFHFVHGDLFNGIRRAEAVLEHGAGAQVAEFGLDEGAKIARRPVLDAEHGVQVVVVLDDHAGAELGRGNRHAGSISFISNTVAGKVAEGRRATFSAHAGTKGLFYTGLGQFGNWGTLSLRPAEKD